jgi:hypothetical protein
MSFLITSQVMIMYLVQSKAYFERDANRTELVNECLNLLVVYHLISFSDTFNDPETSFNCGYSLCFVIFISLLFNLNRIIRGFVRQFKGKKSKAKK